MGSYFFLDIINYDKLFEVPLVPTGADDELIGFVTVLSIINAASGFAGSGDGYFQRLPQIVNRGESLPDPELLFRRNRCKTSAESISSVFFGVAMNVLSEFTGKFRVFTGDHRFVRETAILFVVDEKCNCGYNSHNKGYY